MSIGDNQADRILPATRWVGWLVIPFLVVAFVILYLLPQRTEQLFAWKIQPPMTAMMLGAAYAGGIYFFARLLMARQWHRIKVGLLPVTTFASLLGIATLLHWDRFNHSHISFVAWALLYFTTPFIVLAVWWRNRREESGLIAADDILVPPLLRRVIGAVGALTLAVSLFLFFVPSAMIALWPWTLTPLTARVMGAMFSLPGLVGLGIAGERRWSAAQIILQSQGFSILLILLAALRDWPNFDQAKPATWLFVGGLLGMLLGIVLLYWTMESRRGQLPVPTQPVTATRK